MTDQDAEALLDLLGSSTRRRLLELLSQRPHFVTEMSDLLEVGRKAIIDHLSALEDAGMVDSTDRVVKRGRPRKYYSISDSSFLRCCISSRRLELRLVSAPPKPRPPSPLMKQIHQLEQKARRHGIQSVQPEVTELIHTLEKNLDQLEKKWDSTSQALSRARKLKA